jgi:hypothetical protein
LCFRRKPFFFYKDNFQPAPLQGAEIVFFRPWVDAHIAHLGGLTEIAFKIEIFLPPDYGSNTQNSNEKV